jgi:hypothetical protein
MMQRWTKAFLVAIFFYNPAHAEPMDWGFQLKNASAEYSQSNVWRGHFIAPNGVKFDVSHLYQSDRLEFNLLAQLLVLNPKPNTNFILPIRFDNGYKSPLYSAHRRLDVGFWAVHSHNEKLMLAFGFSNILTIGGKIQENPCLDSFLREFHCGSGVPWVDYKDHSHTKKMMKEIAFKIRYSF